MSTVVHLHAQTGPCRTECGQPCGSRETTAYRSLDAERVTCRACIGAAMPVGHYPETGVSYSIMAQV